MVCFLPNTDDQIVGRGNSLFTGSALNKTESKNE